MDLGLEILDLQILQRAVLILTKDHIYEFLIYDNCTDLRENRIFIISQFPNDQKKGIYQFLNPANQANSRFFSLYDQTSKTIYIIQHSKIQNSASDIFYTQRLQGDDKINQIVLSQDLKHLNYVNTSNIWHISLAYSPETLKFSDGLGKSVKVLVKATGIFCVSYPYNFTWFVDTSLSASSRNVQKYLYSDPYYYNPAQPCTRTLEISVKFPWSLFILMLIGMGCVVVLGALILCTVIARNILNSENPVQQFTDEAENKVSIPKVDTQGNAPTEHHEVYHNGQDQTGLIRKIEMNSTPTVTKRGTGELSFGPDDDDLAKRLKSFEQTKKPPSSDNLPESQDTQ